MKFLLAFARSVILPASLSFGMAMLFISGCASETAPQAVATGIYASGYVAASDSMSANVNVLSQLQDVAKKLPTLNSGTLSPGDLGTLQGELNNVYSTIPTLQKAFPADNSKLGDAESFLAGVIASNSALNGGKAPTASQVLATTALTDFANGLTDGIAYWQGKQAVPTIAH